jgi:holo-[acyl-carrier protein] synthase
MDIFGIGTDIVEIARIKNAIHKTPRFAQKILGEQEYEIWQQHKNISFIAKRFAAKEALAKALKIGFRQPLKWHEIQILPSNNNRHKGAPEFIFNGDTLSYINDNSYICHISLADEHMYAVAYAIVVVNNK